MGPGQKPQRQVFSRSGPNGQMRCIYQEIEDYKIIIYLEKLSIQFALLKTYSIFDTDRCQGKFYDIDRV